MELGITIPLQKHLKQSKPDYGGFADPFFCWELHIIRYEKKNTLIMTNVSNRFTFIMAGMMAKDWKNLKETAVLGIGEAFADAGYTLEEIDRYLAMADKPIITKTHGRKPVGWLNLNVDYLNYIAEPIETERLYQSLPSSKLNDYVFRIPDASHPGTPKDFLRSDMQRMGILAE